MRILLFFLFSTATVNAQAVRLGQFDEIKVFDGIRVTLIPSEADSLVVEGKNKEFLSYKNKNGKLVGFGTSKCLRVMIEQFQTATAALLLLSHKPDTYV